MAISFSCQKCGKKLKAPDNAAGKSSKCPGCGSTVTCPEAVYDAELMEAAPAGLDPFGDLDSDRPYAMRSEPVEAAAPSGEARRPCPMCGEMIVASAAKCRYCGEVFDPTLKKVKKKGKKGKSESENPGVGDIVVALLCPIIALIAGVVWAIQGKPKGWKMVILAIVSGAINGLVVNYFQHQPGGMGP
jgi:predicted RNA-binding Zn-ribbon protein involved in translation (DUF1610 family)